MPRVVSAELLAQEFARNDMACDGMWQRERAKKKERMGKGKNKSWE